jgi:acyl-CoA thioesterase
MVEKGVVKTAFGHTAKVLWDESGWLIASVRQEDSGYYRDWQSMLIDMGYLPAEPAA